MSLHVYPGPADLAVAVAGIVADLIATDPGPFSLGLAGGSTPRAAYQFLAGTSPGWERVTAWLADERWVTPDSARSNGRMASEALFSRVPARFVRPDWAPDLDPEESAARYGRLLAGLEETSGPHQLILLGMGDDGHTASLFPGSAALGETRHRYVSNIIPATGEVRLTATYPLLWNAVRVMFLVSGAAKAEALKLSLAGVTPAGRVADGSAAVEWHVDRAAASQLG